MLKDKEKCCGCGACYNICPKNAITMKANEEGFVYPVIDRGKCINCGLCTEVCSFEPMGEYKPMEVYAAAEKSNSILQKSASGGIFASCAREILKKKGVVFGSALEYSHGYLHVHHIAIENIQDLTDNVRTLHKFLFNEADYTPSEKVSTLNAQLLTETGAASTGDIPVPGEETDGDADDSGE